MEQQKLPSRQERINQLVARRNNLLAAFYLKTKDLERIEQDLQLIESQVIAMEGLVDAPAPEAESVDH